MEDDQVKVLSGLVEQIADSSVDFDPHAIFSLPFEGHLVLLALDLLLAQL